MEAVRFTCLNSSLENADLGVNAQVRDYLQYLTYASYEVLVAFLFFASLVQETRAFSTWKAGELRTVRTWKTKATR